MTEIRSRARVIVAVAAAIACTQVAVGAAFGGSEFAAGDRSVSSFDRYRGEHEIRTNPTPPSGVGAVMGMQLATDYTGAFMAVGTAKGAGVANCPDAYGGTWEVYTDGVTPGGVYFCFTDGPSNEYGIGARQGFSILHAACGWQLNYGGTLRRCLTQPGYPSTGVRMIAMIEEAGAVAADFNIDAKYFELEYSTNGGSSWHDMIPSVHADPGYTAQTPANRRVNAFYGTLD